MMERAVALTLLLGAGLAVAQRDQPLTPGEAFRARFQEARPALTLFVTVVGILDLERRPDLAVTQEQARSLLPVVEALPNKPTLSADEAGQILDFVRQEVLTPEQLLALRDVNRGRIEGRSQRNQIERRQFGQRRGDRDRGGLQGFFGGGTGRGGELGGGRGGFRSLLLGEDFNPFRAGPGVELTGQVLKLLEVRSRQSSGLEFSEP